MIRGPREWMLFLIAGTVTLLCWKFFRPDDMRKPIPAGEPPVTDLADRSWGRAEIDSRLAAVANAPTDAERLAASTELLRIPVEAVPELLEGMKSRIEKDFPPEGRILLMRWASADGEAAVNWAWKRFRSGYRWKDVFNEIGATWTTHDPAGFMKWAVEASKRSSNPWDSSTPLKEAESSDLPLLNGELMRKIPEWLITESPYLAHKFILKTGAKVYRPDMARAMDSVQDVRDALAACDEDGGVDPSDGLGGDDMRKTLLRRWFELDPDDFSHSRHAAGFTLGSTDAAQMLSEQWNGWPETERSGKADRMLAQVDAASKAEVIRLVATEWAKTDSAATIRWLDSLPPEDSAYAANARVGSLAAYDLTGTLEWADQLPQEQRQDLLIRAFDSWMQAHPGQRADRTGWPDSRMKAWEDLEALSPVNGK